MTTTTPLIDTIIEGIQEKKGRGVTVVDLSAMDGAIASAFIIAEGGSPTQVEAIAGEVSDRVRTALGEKPVGVIGLEACQWVAIDYVDVMVHIFLPETRAYYDLDHLWADAPMRHVADLD